MTAVAIDGLQLVLRAAAFAAERHSQQRRKGIESTPYINHPLAVARVLCEEGGIVDPELIAAALLHDTVEDTPTSMAELKRAFGERVAGLVVEVTDDKGLDKLDRKRLQVEHAAHISRDAQQIKLADKICNLRDILASPPVDWPTARKMEYFDWAKAVVDRLRDANPALARRFDAEYARKQSVA